MSDNKPNCFNIDLEPSVNNDKKARDAARLFTNKDLVIWPVVKYELCRDGKVLDKYPLSKSAKARARRRIRKMEIKNQTTLVH